MDFELTLLKYLAEEEFCTRAELREFGALWGVETSVVDDLVQSFLSRGWIDQVDADLVQITNTAFEARPEIRGAGRLTSG